MDDEEKSEDGHISEDDMDYDWIDTDNADHVDHATSSEQLMEHICLLRDFCDGMEYQIQFGDSRMLSIFELEARGCLQLAKDCLSCKCWFNSS